MIANFKYYYHLDHYVRIPKTLARTTRSTKDCCTEKDLQKVKRATKTHKPSTSVKQRIALANEKKLAKGLKIKGTKHQPDNEAFDVVIGSKGKPKHCIEVKSIIDNKNDKITMHKDSLSRKVKEARRHKARMHTVVFDTRSNKMYYANRCGSFRLSSESLTEVKSFKEIQEHILQSEKKKVAKRAWKVIGE